MNAENNVKTLFFLGFRNEQIQFKDTNLWWCAIMAALRIGVSAFMPYLQYIRGYTHLWLAEQTVPITKQLFKIS